MKRDDNTFYYRLNCFPYQLQEPYFLFIHLISRYLVLKYTSSLPLFDERFVNYGYNKIEYTQQLRHFCLDFD